MTESTACMSRHQRQASPMKAPATATGPLSAHCGTIESGTAGCDLGSPPPWFLGRFVGRLLSTAPRSSQMGWVNLLRWGSHVLFSLKLAYKPNETPPLGSRKFFQDLIDTISVIARVAMSLSFSSRTPSCSKSFSTNVKLEATKSSRPSGERRRTP